MHPVLKGLKVLELSGLGPAPFTGFILQDYGAKVTRIINPTAIIKDSFLSIKKESVKLDLKSSDGFQNFKERLRKTDVLLDPYRPGTLERLGIDFKDLLENEAPHLIVARFSGYGQTENGAYISRPGHDINFLAESGALWCLTKKDEDPFPPPVLIADMAGGAFPAVMGILLALIDRSKTNKGQIVDANLTGGTSYIMSMLHVSRQEALREKSTFDSTVGFPMPSESTLLWNDVTCRGVNFLDGAAPFYRVYRTRDNNHVAVGAIEPHYYKKLLKGLGICHESAPQMDKEAWPRLCDYFSSIFLTKTRQEWLEYNDGYLVNHACLSPVWTPEEALQKRPKNQFREYSNQIKVPQPVPKLTRP